MISRWTIKESYYHAHDLFLSTCHFISGKSDVPSSQNIPNNNNCHSQTSINSNKNSLKNRITKYYKRCRRTMRSAFLRLRRWVSEHHRVLLWHCYCTLSLFMFTDTCISAVYLFPYVHIHVYCTVYCAINVFWCTLIFYHSSVTVPSFIYLWCYFLLFQYETRRSNLWKQSAQSCYN